MPKSKITACLNVTYGHGYKAPPGRNEPCPCKSGKKFKKCCGAKYSDYMSEQLKEAHRKLNGSPGFNRKA